VGIGSEFRGDDAAGALVAAYLRDWAERRDHVKVLSGGSAPENLTGEIKQFRATHLLLIDAADAGAEPGTYHIIEPEQASGASCSTHRPPLHLFTRYLQDALGCEIVIIGIQPERLDWGSSPSDRVKESCERLAQMLRDSWGD